MYNKISVTILTKDSTKYIKECLEALVRFDEVIILDNGSTDDTMEKAKNFKNVKIYENEFIGFGALKNLVISKAANSWIFSVDSDEIISTELVEEILTLDLDNTKVYSILRDNYYNKKLVKCCGWDNDFVNRLFNKNTTKFNEKQVHESLILNDNIKLEKLKNSFKHYSFDEASQLLHKMDKYSTLYASEHKGIKSSSPAKALFRSMFSFIKNYFFQKGFLCGYEGLIISISNANGVFYKYIKLYEENKK
ncbi:MAG: glycosyltransferase family 2 protein [Arcobacteraceae bacterium]|nr:glycosyltransferase family 2 protein [Arcobacteraceae bacterium]